MPDDDAVSALFARLSSSPRGLASAEAKGRIMKYGHNEVPEKKKNPLVQLLSRLWGPIPWMIELAAALSFMMGRTSEFGLIASMLVVNAAIGFWQERKAGSVLRLLDQKVSRRVFVLRDGAWTEIDGRELVPGDIVHVRRGEMVPSDVVLINGDGISLDESSLTGESVPAQKRRLEQGYAGSIVIEGEMDALVTRTGAGTKFGRAARLSIETKTKSSFERLVLGIGNYLIVAALIMVGLVLVVSVSRGAALGDILTFCLVLLVSAMPVAMPAVLSVTLFIGAQDLAKKGAIVTHLTALQELAQMDVLCTDKTGTLTTNHLIITDVVAGKGFDTDDVLVLAALASRKADADPIDSAVLAGAKGREGVMEQLEEFTPVSLSPFDPISKRVVATVEDKAGRRVSIAKGATQSIASLTGRHDLEGRVERLAAKGHRCLAVAVTDSNRSWRFAGMLVMNDPPRDDASKTIKTAEQFGIRIKMVTGDHLAIAREIARQIGIGATILLPSAFTQTDERGARSVVESADGFAQVFPEHKVRIVELLQSLGHTVGMTGDGVNDAPALSRAQAGIAVAGATDAARAASDIVLLRPGLSTIINAVLESHAVFHRMLHYVIYRVAESIRILLFMTLSILAFNAFPLSSLQIVLLTLLNDLPILSIAYDRTRSYHKPDAWNMGRTLGIATYLGLVGVVFSFLLYVIGMRIFNLDGSALQSFIFLKLVVAGHLLFFSARSRRNFWSDPPSPVLAATVIATQLVGTIVAVYGIGIAPLGWSVAGFVWGYSLVEFLVTDMLKPSVREYLVEQFGSGGTRIDL